MLANTLSAFELVKYPENTEIVVVNNNSTDSTAETIRNFSDRLPIQYTFESKQGLNAARNKGIYKARGKLVVFTDDDVRPCPEWLTSYLDAYRQNPKWFFWGGSVVSEFEGSTPDKRLLRFAPPSVKGLDLGTQKRNLQNNWIML